MENSPWLAVMAIAAMVQSIILVGIAIGAFRIYRTATETIERVERQALAPLVKGVHRAVDRIDSVVDRVESADEEVRAVIGRTQDRVARVASVLRAGLGPVVGLGLGARAALAAFSAAPRRPTMRPGRWPRASDRVNPEEALFVYEGGTDHARS